MREMSGSAMVGATVAAAVMLAAGGAEAANASDTPSGVEHAAMSTRTADPWINVANCVSQGNLTLCVGVNYSGSIIENVQIQVAVTYPDDEIAYAVGGPSHWSDSAGPISGGPGWAPQKTFNVGYALGSGPYCGDAAADNQVIQTCVDVP